MIRNSRNTSNLKSKRKLLLPFKKAPFSRKIGISSHLFLCRIQIWPILLHHHRRRRRRRPHTHNNSNTKPMEAGPTSSDKLTVAGIITKTTRLRIRLPIRTRQSAIIQTTIVVATMVPVLLFPILRRRRTKVQLVVPTMALLLRPTIILSSLIRAAASITTTSFHPLQII